MPDRFNVDKRIGQLLAKGILVPNPQPLADLSRLHDPLMTDMFLQLRDCTKQDTLSFSLYGRLPIEVILDPRLASIVMRVSPSSPSESDESHGPCQGCQGRDTGRAGPGFLKRHLFQ